MARVVMALVGALLLAGAAEARVVLIGAHFVHPVGWHEPQSWRAARLAERLPGNVDYTWTDRVAGEALELVDEGGDAGPWVYRVAWTRTDDANASAPSANESVLQRVTRADGRFLYVAPTDLARGIEVTWDGGTTLARPALAREGASREALAEAFLDVLGVQAQRSVAWNETTPEAPDLPMPRLFGWRAEPAAQFVLDCLRCTVLVHLDPRFGTQLQFAAVWFDGATPVLAQASAWISLERSAVLDETEARAPLLDALAAQHLNVSGARLERIQLHERHPTNVPRIEYAWRIELSDGAGRVWTARALQDAHDGTLRGYPDEIVLARDAPPAPSTATDAPTTQAPASSATRDAPSVGLVGALAALVVAARTRRRDE